mmetsp:Transcript_30289/g.96832  ORF Transcript_30289/g.96832 Transcript_30289/m.96832 type:complete len:291 (-) Transcript_30289:1201-2073(-)
MRPWEKCKWGRGTRLKTWNGPAQARGFVAEPALRHKCPAHAWCLCEHGPMTRSREPPPGALMLIGRSSKWCQMPGFTSRDSHASTSRRRPWHLQPRHDWEAMARVSSPHPKHWRQLGLHGSSAGSSSLRAEHTGHCHPSATWKRLNAAQSSELMDCMASFTKLSPAWKVQQEPSTTPKLQWRTTSHNICSHCSGEVGAMEVDACLGREAPVGSRPALPTGAPCAEGHSSSSNLTIAGSAARWRSTIIPTPLWRANLTSTVCEASACLDRRSLCSLLWSMLLLSSVRRAAS